MSAQKLTQERVQELLDYDPETGVFTWKKRKISFNRESVKAGRVAGSVQNNGYYLISVDKTRHLSHRLAWLYVYGYLPENEIDHINKNPGDNRIKNLREVSHSCNMRNTGNGTNTTSGVKGVSLCNKTNKWRAVIKLNQKFKHIGLFKSFDEAVCDRLAAEQCLNWSGCDSESPALKYVKKNIQLR